MPKITVKGVTLMKKIISLCVLIALAAVFVTSLTACGDDKKTNKNTTAQSLVSTTRESTTMLPGEENGRVSDVSREGDNGIAGDIVSDVSRGLTELSEAISEAF